MSGLPEDSPAAESSQDPYQRHSRGEESPQGGFGQSKGVHQSQPGFLPKGASLCGASELHLKVHIPNPSK